MLPAAAQVHPAPGPEEVNWQHLWLTWRERDCRTILTWPFLVLVVCFPITLCTSAVGRLDYVLCNSPDKGPQVPVKGGSSQQGLVGGMIYMFAADEHSACT